MKEDLFKEFKPATAADWKKQIVKDLKGGTFEDLIWHNENDFKVSPFYNAEDLKIKYTPCFSHADWDICAEARGNSAEEMNRQLLGQLSKGATSIVCEPGSADIDILLKDVQLEFIRSTFIVNEENHRQLAAYLKANYSDREVKACIFPSRFENAADLEWYVKMVNGNIFPASVSAVSANVLPFHQSGCNASYEIALAFSMLVELLESSKSGWKTPPVIFAGISADYFIQLSKLRAMRRLWNVIRNEYKITEPLHIIVQTSLTNKTISDSYNNLLRTTVESMAAVAGGCNELIVLPFDELFPVNPALSQRMALNQQLILKEESYLNKMADVGCGSYYIEAITDELASKGLELFRKFESMGGYMSCMDKKMFDADISIQSRKHAEAVRSGTEVVVGVNKFRNADEKTEVTADLLAKLRNSPVHNAALDYELENFYFPKNA